MKIVINAVSAKSGGAVSYITNLLQYLSTIEGDVQFLVFLPPETASKLEGLTQNVRVIPTGIGHAGMLRRMVWEQLTLRIFLKRERADALYSTANFAMFCCPVQQLLLVRNALYFSSIYRQMFLPRHSLRYRVTFWLRRWLMIRSSRAAGVVMTPTQTMLDELRSRADVKNAIVNPYGVTVAEAVADETGRQPEEMGNRVVRLLYVSLYGEHKNISTLLKALALLNDRSSVQFKLVTTADPAWPGATWTVTYKEDLALARQTEIAEHISFVGPLNRQDTAGLYRTSDICVFPSLTESFGFPLAEAMSHGLPVLAADTPVNREMCGHAAIYFSPLSAEDLAGRLLRLAMDSDLCRRLGTRAREESAGRFCWDVHARRLLEAVGCRPENIWRDPEGAPGPMDANPPNAPVSVLVLTRNEEANIAACLESADWADEVFVVDSFSTDRTAEIAESLGAKVLFHRFRGYAAQRNWALDNLPFSNDWVLMLDADERVPQELAVEISRLVQGHGKGHAGFYLKFRHIFLGRWLKHGGLYPTWILRLFRRQRVRFEERPMNEHAILEGSAGYLQQPFDHRDRKPLADWVARHNRYASLEVEEFLQETHAGGYGSSIRIRFWGSHAERKRWIKLKVWNRLPLLLRPFLLFFRNYLLKLGFLDGRPGLIYHVLWSFWYPFLISARILEMQQAGSQSTGLRLPVPGATQPAAVTAAAQETRK